jgi:osmotically-inducible protein OsmY
MTRTPVRVAGKAAWIGLVAFCFVAPSAAQQTPPDNTKANKTASAKPTADQQKSAQADMTITRDIRRAIVNDKNLSSYAHNVKVITQHGQVTLKGPVRSEDEKKMVEAKATEVAGAGHVKNQITIAPAK